MYYWYLYSNIQYQHQGGCKSFSKTIKIPNDALSSILSRNRVSSVGIATGYGMDGLGIESRWGRDFSHTSRPAVGPTQPPVQWVPGISRG
jgi:hypothetical protein